jgi:hypothetical protein
MAAIVWGDVVAHSSPLAGVNVAVQADLIAAANATINVALFGGEDAPRTRLARIYWCAHFASLPGAGENRAAGPVTSESREGLSRSYASPASSGGDDGGFGETQWGRRYLELLRSSRARWPRVPGQ